MREKTTVKILISTSIIALGISAILAVSQISKIENFSSVFSALNHNKKIRVLIVPGHEPNAGGTNYKNIYERDLNLQLSEIIKNDLSANPNIEVFLARDNNGWNTDLQNYITASSTAIMNWVVNMKKEMLSKIKLGEIKTVDLDRKYTEANYRATLYLYGTNKWANENNIDLVLNVHFNNNKMYLGSTKYGGYCMYIPDSQYGNASSSRILANYLSNEISKIENKSNIFQEKDTIIEDQQLIAIGNYDTLKIPSVVIEYAYIFEPMMLSSSTRNNFLKNAASSTATAIQNYIKNEFEK